MNSCCTMSCRKYANYKNVCSVFNSYFVIKVIEHFGQWFWVFLEIEYFSKTLNLLSFCRLWKVKTCYVNLKRVMRGLETFYKFVLCEFVLCGDVLCGDSLYILMYRESPHNTFLGGNKTPCYAKSCYASPILVLKYEIGGKLFQSPLFVQFSDHRAL